MGKATDDDDDDGTIWDAFKVRAQEQAKKRASNRDSSPELLKKAEIPFTVHNNGAHLVIRNNDFWIDFWPGTGLWHARIPVDHHGRGVFNLIAFLDKHQYRQHLPPSPEPELRGKEPKGIIVDDIPLTRPDSNQPPWD